MCTFKAFYAFSFNITTKLILFNARSVAFYKMGESFGALKAVSQPVSKIFILKIIKENGYNFKENNFTIFLVCPPSQWGSSLEGKGANSPSRVDSILKSCLIQRSKQEFMSKMNRC